MRIVYYEHIVLMTDMMMKKSQSFKCQRNEYLCITIILRVKSRS